MFEGPEHETYVALCRELRLERLLEEGDYYLLPEGPLGQAGGQGVEVLLCLAQGSVAYATERQPWLPRLDQWLAMLEAAGHDDIQIQRCGNQMEPPLFHAATRFRSPRRVGNGPSREEACARLWMAVTGR